MKKSTLFQKIIILTEEIQSKKVIWNRIHFAKTLFQPFSVSFFSKNFLIGAFCSWDESRVFKTWWVKTKLQLKSFKSYIKLFNKFNLHLKHAPLLSLFEFRNFDRIKIIFFVGKLWKVKVLTNLSILFEWKGVKRRRCKPPCQFQPQISMINFRHKHSLFWPNYSTSYKGGKSESVIGTKNSWMK